MDVDDRVRTTVPRGRTTAAVVAVLTWAALLVACEKQPAKVVTQPPAQPVVKEDRQPQPVTLGFAGDVHFERHLARLLDGRKNPLGSIARTLRAPDLMMLNLESAIATGGRPQKKEYTFRTSPEALRVLADAGVDVVTMGNNHAADYGRKGLRETFAAIDDGPIPVVGVGRNKEAAFAPYRTTVKGNRISVFGVSSRYEHTAKNFAAKADAPGVAVAFEPKPYLLDAVRRADTAGDVVIVYLHWGREFRPCPTLRQERLARALADAGADVIVGSHTHVLAGAGWLGDSYVSYGLADFIWYHDHRPETGVLTLRVRNGEVVRDRFMPALIQPDGVPHADSSRSALRGWERLRSCAGLADKPPAG